MKHGYKIVLVPFIFDVEKRMRSGYVGGSSRMQLVAE
jgi:hypothetical protein